jgi:hypothetical protein
MIITRGPVRVSELASWQGVDKPTVTPQVHRLEQRGVVSRHGDPADFVRSGKQPALPGQPLSHLRANSAAMETGPSGRRIAGNDHRRPHPVRR